MKRNRKSPRPQVDTPATRKWLLQKRLQEISDKGEQELAGIKQTIEQIRSNFKPRSKK